MKKIIIVINSLLMGGAERQVVNDANMLSVFGHNITIAFGQDGPLRKEVSGNVKLHCFQSKSEMKVAIKLLWHLKKNNYDVVFAHMFWALKASAIPCGLTKHKLLFFEHGLGLWRKWYHLVIIKLNERFVSKVIVVSEKKITVKVDREGYKREKIIKIPNSFIPKNIHFIKSTDRDVVSIVFSGRFNPVKQLHFLPEIAVKLKKLGVEKFVFELLGSGSEEKRIREKAKELNVQDNFIFHGFVFNPIEILIKCDFAVLPSRIEDFSVSLLEKSYAKLPTIAFDVGGNSEIVLNNKTGFLIEAFNLDHFAEKCKLLINDKRLVQKMGQAAHHHVKSNFTEKQRLNRLNNLLSSLEL